MCVCVCIYENSRKKIRGRVKVYTQTTEQAFL